MHTLLSTFLAIHALSAGALATPASIIGRSGVFGTVGDDADLTISTWNNPDCIPTLEGARVNLSWSSSKPTTGPTQSFTLSRALTDTERLDWSAAATDVRGKLEALVEFVSPECLVYLKSMRVSPPSIPDALPLQRDTCYSLGMVANVSCFVREVELV